MPYAVAVAVGPEGLIHAANAAWTRMAGAANPRLVLGTAFRQFFPSAAAAPIAVLKGDGAVVSQRGVPHAAQPDEAPTWWDLDLVPHPEEPDAVLITARDVTADVLARQAADPRPLAERHQRRPHEVSRVGDVVLVVRPSDGAILEANDAATAVYGYSRDELTEMRIHDLRAPETVGVVDAQLSESRTHGFLFETLHRRRDGTVFPVEVSAIGADFRGHPITVSVVRDVTARHQAEVALAKSETRLRRMVDALPMAAWLQRPDGTAEFCNRRFTDYFGAGTRGAAIAGCIDQIHTEDRPRAHAAWRQAIETGATFEIEARARRTDNVWRWHRFRIVPVAHEEDGRLDFSVGTAVDIHDMRTAAEQIAARERLLTAAQEAASIGVFERDLRTERATWSPTMFRLYGLDPAAHAQDPTMSHADYLAFLDPRDLDQHLAARQALARSREPRFAFEFRIRRADTGAVRWIASRGEIERDARGSPVRAIGVNFDVTEAREATEALLRSEARLRRATEAGRLATFEVDNPGAGEEARVSEGFRFLWGLPADASCNFEAILSRVHPDDRDRVVADHVRLASEGGRYESEFRVVLPDGTIRWLFSSGEADPGDRGMPRNLRGVNFDITDRKCAEAAVAESEARLRRLTEATREGVCVHAFGRIIDVNRSFAEMFGYAPADLPGRDVFDLIHPDHRESVRARALAGDDHPYESVGQRQDGSIFPVEFRGQTRTWDGERLRFVNVRDLTEVKAARRADLLVRAFTDRANDLLALVDVETARFIYVNETAAATFGHTVEHALTLGVADIDPGWNEARFRDLVAALERGETVPSFESTLRRKDGSVVPVEIKVALIEHEGRRVIGAVLRDITARKLAEDALADSEARFRTLAEAVPQIVWTADAEGRLDWHSPRWTEYTGLSAGNRQDNALDWRPAIHPGDLARTEQAWTEAVETGTHYEVEHRIRGADGTWRWFLSRAVPLRDGPDGPVLRWSGTATDIHDRRMLEEELRRLNQDLEARVAERTRALSDAARELATEMRRREEAQTALLQSQKLEALGQLTGGIAHDFNNILAAIRGGYELLERRIDEPKALTLIRHGQHAAERATRLIAQLMAFARREELRPRLIDPARALRGSEDMICHTAGPRVRCDFEIAAEVWPVIVDTVRLETVLLNLAANARDAMPGGGRLTVALRNAAPAEVPPGLPRGRDHVLISMADTGTGMNAETLQRATEPFFTTKPAGKGTGLGLASAHAFAQQSDGALRLTSAPDEGTTVTLFLPRAGVLPARHETEGLGSDEAALLDTSRHGDATVLVVDDDEGVRLVTAGFLRDLGYSVIEAPNAEVAVTLAHGDEPIDLLVTDVMMPGVPGPVLAARLRTERPNLPVLYITAHAGGAALGNDPMLGKPFTDAVLARAVLAGLGRLGPAAQDDMSTDTDRLGGRLRGEALRSAYGRWRTQRIQRSGALPPIDAFERALPDNIDEALFLVAVEPTPGSGFRMMRIGRALREQLGRTPKDSSALDSMFHEPGHMLGGSIGAAYRRCVESRGPVYDYARFAFGDGRPMLFERLILPLSEDGGVTVTHMAGVALFTEVAIGETAGRGSAR